MIDHEKMNYDEWSQPLYFREVTGLALHDDNHLQITYSRDAVGSEWLKMGKFGAQQQAVLDAAANYHARYATAAEHQQHRKTSRDENNNTPQEGEA